MEDSVTLVPLTELLVKYEISRATYHNLLNKGFLPHYAKRHGEPGKKGARYLYDAEAFEEAWVRYRERTARGVGINVEKRDKRYERMERMTLADQIDFILQDFPLDRPEESLEEYDTRAKARRVELGTMPGEVVKEMAMKLFRQGFRPTSWPSGWK
jgi:hypothetical protein